LGWVALAVGFVLPSANLAVPVRVGAGCRGETDAIREGQEIFPGVGRVTSGANWKTLEVWCFYSLESLELLEQYHFL